MLMELEEMMEQEANPSTTTEDRELKKLPLMAMAPAVVLVTVVIVGAGWLNENEEDCRFAATT
jgi:hypothetical protein